MSGKSTLMVNTATITVAATIRGMKLRDLTTGWLQARRHADGQYLACPIELMIRDGIRVMGMVISAGDIQSNPAMPICIEPKTAIFSKDRQGVAVIPWWRQSLAVASSIKQKQGVA
ncbi:MAG TPA: hypothetical protein VHL14_13790 [Steroidobacteraceae bacterium]|nr:hypothetical protein [Steroidobacteraceae bacterium]